MRIQTPPKVNCLIPKTLKKSKLKKKQERILSAGPTVYSNKKPPTPPPI